MFGLGSCDVTVCGSEREQTAYEFILLVVRAENLPGRGALHHSNALTLGGMRGTVGEFPLGYLEWRAHVLNGY